MGGIYISGIDKPKYGRCITIWPDGRITTEFGSYTIGNAIFLSDHGRLGDLDELESRWTPDEEYYPTEEERRAYLNGKLTVRDFQSSIHDARTIIPADGKV